MWRMWNMGTRIIQPSNGELDVPGVPPDLEGKVIYIGFSAPPEVANDLHTPCLVKAVGDRHFVPSSHDACVTGSLLRLATDLCLT